MFSRAAAGELSDLYSVGRKGPDWQQPEPLATTPEVAESQPAATWFEVWDCTDPDGCRLRAEQTWVAFTTTEFRPEGTIAFISPDAPGDVVSEPWDDSPQASEPTWSSTENPTHLAFTSTDDDPYGAIGIAQVASPTLSDEGMNAPEVDGFGIVGDNVSGIGESHPFWLREFDSEELDDARLVYTSRSHDGVAGGSRILDADISDVLAVDGGQRRVIRHQRELAGSEVVHRFDEAGPSYSPDGRRIVYSRDTDPAAETGGARVLVVADADGSDAAPLLPDSQRESNDLDLDPVWSPDGTRVAFVRIRSFGGEFPGPSAPEIWVYGLTTELATRIPGTPDGADLSPSWAPDSRHLVIARSQEDGGPPYDSARRWGSYRASSSPELYVLDATEPTAPALGFDTCRDECAVSGRTPAWSPDGSRIVYVADGQLRLITLPDPCCAGPVIDIENPIAVTGFDLSSGEPTPSRSVVSTAHDPTWSPDNREIAFAGQPAGQPDQRGIWGIGPDGSGLRPITDERGPETEPAYQPDRAADVGVTMTVANSPALIGAEIVATFTVTNHGPATAAEVTLDTGFAAEALLTAPATPPGCRVDGSGCGFAVLASGESHAYQVSVRHQDAVLGAAIGTVAADNPDPDGSNNAASAPYRVQAPDLQTADLRVRVKVDHKIGYVGGPRIATLRVRNIGTVPVDDVLLTTTWSDLLLPDVAPTTTVGNAGLPARGRQLRPRHDRGG